MRAISIQTMPKSLQLVKLPAATLRERSIEVAKEDIGTADFQSFLDDLEQTMRNENGVGIAAPQVGRNIRVFLVDGKPHPAAFINPEVSAVGRATQDSEEGCLSVPGIWGLLKREKKVRVRALDRHGRRVSLEAKGFMATVYQHEQDHLDGILFVDKAVSTLKGDGKTRV